VNHNDKARSAARLFVLICAVAGPALGQKTIYVDNRNGNDAAAGLAAKYSGRNQGPVQTVQTALRRVPNGGRIVLLPTAAPYAEPFVIDGGSRGTAHQPLVIEGNGNLLIGEVPIDPEDWQPFTRSVVRHPHPMTSMTRFLAGAETIPIALVPQPNDLPAEHLTFHDGQVYFCPRPGARIEDYDLRRTSPPAAIMINRASHIVLRHFRIRGYRIDGIQVKGPADDIRIEDCVVEGASRAGLSVSTNSRVAVTNVSFVGNRKVGVLVDNVANVVLDRVAVADSVEHDRCSPDSRLVDRGGQFTPFPEGPFTDPSPKIGMPTGDEPIQDNTSP
jgi:hypothetical protein